MKASTSCVSPAGWYVAMYTFFLASSTIALGHHVRPCFMDNFAFGWSLFEGTPFWVVLKRDSRKGQRFCFVVFLGGPLKKDIQFDMLSDREARAAQARTPESECSA